MAVILWIESQPTAVIALVMLAICYAFAAAVFALAGVVARRRVAVELKALTPVMMTPLSVIAGLLIVFLAAHVWANFDHAGAYVAEEASAIRESVLLAEALPQGMRDAVRAGVDRYLRFVEADDWPAMVARRANLHRPPPGLVDAISALLAYAPTGAGQQFAQQRSVIALERALEARRSRILLSEAPIAPIQWLVVFVLDGLILLTIAMVHLDRRAATAAGLLIFSTAVAACLVLLMVNDR
ncbi:MAG: DUF4239 domain-containing protein, partial [Acetobacteraceae bacterium]|nr:DUF4239 domain-containing protein [Acetobacteraceae bacterium]